MTRLYYWLHAETQYGLHSPFLFEMYRRVLFARLTGEECRRHGIRPGDRYGELIWKCRDYYQLEAAEEAPQATAGTTLLVQQVQQKSSLAINGQPDSGQFSILIVDHPHGSEAAERGWERMKGDPSFHVSIDLYDVALLIRNARLSPQHLLLR